MMMPAWVVHAAMLVVAVPPAIEMRPVRVAMHMAPMARARVVHLAMFVVSVPSAIQMAPVRVAMHVSVMMAMPVTLEVLRLLHEAFGTEAARLARSRLCSCRRKSQN